MAAIADARPVVGYQQEQLIPIHQEGGRFTREVLDMLREAIAAGGRAAGRDIVAFIGSTGAAKSTMINCLLGRRMVQVNNDGILTIGVEGGPQNEIAEIGQGLINSTTRFAHAYTGEGIDYTLVDCGGFDDTRGPATEIANAVSMKLIFENARSVRLVLCSEESTVSTVRGQVFTNQIQQACRQLLGERYGEHQRAIALILTRLPLTHRMDHAWYTIEDPNRAAYNLLLRCRNQLPEGAIRRAFYDFVVREEGRYLKTFKPLEEASRLALLTLFGDMEPITEPRGRFHLAYSPATAAAVLRGFTALALNGSDLIDEHNTIGDEEGRLRGELGALEATIQRLDIFLQRSVNQDNPLTAGQIEEMQRELIRNHELAIEAANTAIARLDREIQELEVGEIQANQERRVQWDAEMVDEDGRDIQSEYWVQTLNQKEIPGDPGSSTTVTTKSRGFLGIFGGGSSTTTTIIPPTPGASIPHDFNYHGPTILRIENTFPAGTITNEVGGVGERTYQAHFESGIGKPAHGELRIIIAKRNDPQVQQRLTEIIAEGARHERRKNDLQAQRRVHEQNHAAGQLGLQAARNTVDRVQYIQQEHAQLLPQREAIRNRLAQNQERRAANEREIQALAPEIEFLREYLRLSDDTALRDHPLIQRFRDRYERYLNP